MKLEAIFAEWEQDCVIDRTDLAHESLKISQLHNKYYKMFAMERITLKSLLAELSALKLEKQEFYLMGPTKDQLNKGWVLPAVGKILRADLAAYMEADAEIIKLNLRIGLANEKIDLLESILRTLSTRGYQIKTALDFIRFQNGS